MRGRTAGRLATLAVLTTAVAGCSFGPTAVTSRAAVPPDPRVAAAALSTDATASPLVTPRSERERNEWFAGPVAWLATDDERAQYATLSSAQRSNFVEAFWSRRDPAPDHEANEYRDEIARRVATAQAAFDNTHGPGWSTLFGLGLLVFGYPSEVLNIWVDGERPTERGTVTWFYGLEDAAQQRFRVGYRFQYGAWHMSCHGSLRGVLNTLRGVDDPWVADFFGNAGRNLGGPVNQFGESMATSDVQGSGVDGSRIAHGGGGSGIADPAAIPLISRPCRTAMRTIVQASLRNPAADPAAAAH